MSEGYPTAWAGATERLEAGAFLRAVLDRCRSVAWVVTLGCYARMWWDDGSVTDGIERPMRVVHTWHTFGRALVSGPKGSHCDWSGKRRGEVLGALGQAAEWCRGGISA